MRAFETTESPLEAVVCIYNNGYEVDLELLESYAVVADDTLEPEDVRIIDESGEDYVYPRSYFVTYEEAYRDLQRSRFES